MSASDGRRCGNELRAILDDAFASHLNAVAGRILSQFPPDQARAEFLKWWPASHPTRIWLGYDCPSRAETRKSSSRLHDRRRPSCHTKRNVRTVDSEYSYRSKDESVPKSLLLREDSARGLSPFEHGLVVAFTIGSCKCLAVREHFNGLPETGA
jgi:hypothetical protein